MIFGHVGRPTGESAEDLGKRVAFAFVAFGPEMTFERLAHDLRLGPPPCPRRGNLWDPKRRGAAPLEERPAAGAPEGGEDLFEARPASDPLFPLAKRASARKLPPPHASALGRAGTFPKEFQEDPGVRNGPRRSA